MDAKHTFFRFLPFLLVTMLTLQACDPGFDEYCIIRNNTSQTVTVVPSGHHYVRQNDTEVFDTFDYHPATIAAGADSVVMYNGGIGASSYEQAFYLICQYLGDSVIFRFEDGNQIIFHSTDTVGISPYNPYATCYHWEEKVGKPYAGHVYFGSLTFTIGNEHYQEATQ